MKRGWTLSLCALALIAGAAATAQAQAPNVQLSLNLRYTSPNAPAQGGTWYLAAKTDAPNGIAGVSAYINGINTAGIIYGTTATNFPAQNYTAVAPAQINAMGPNVFVTGTNPVNLVYGQDTSAAGVVTGVGTATFAQRQAADPLRNANWANATILASGTFGATRPTFATAGTNTTDANVLSTATPPFNNSTDANVTTVVRGDSVTTLNLETTPGSGIHFGDRNRNGTVAFLTDIQPSLASIGQGAGKTWEQGDFNGNGTVSFLADIQPALSRIGQPAPPAPVAGVPEPSSLAMVMIGFAAFAAVRRQK